MAILLMSAAVVLAKTGRDALYFQGRGLFDLPKAYMGMALLAIPLALLVLALMRRLGPRRMRIAAALGMAAVLVLYHGVAGPGGGPLMTSFFTLVGLAFGVLFSLYWLLAADLLEGVPQADLARSYSFMGAAAITGGFLGGLTARLLARHFEPRAFLLVSALAIAASAGVVAVTQARFPPCVVARRLSPKLGAESFSLLVRQPYSLLLLSAGMTAALVGIFVEFQFYLAAATSGNDGRQNASLFASVHLVLNGAALVIQLYLTPRIQKAVGVHGSLFVLPTALLGGGAFLLANGSVFARSLLRITEGGVRSSIHRVNWEQAYLPLKGVQRVVAKLLVDGAGRVAEGLGALVLFLWLRLVVGGQSLVGQPTSWVTYALLLTSALWVALTRALGRSVAALPRATAPEELSPRVPLPDT